MVTLGGDLGGGVVRGCEEVQQSWYARAFYGYLHAWTELPDCSRQIGREKQIQYT